MIYYWQLVEYRETIWQHLQPAKQESGSFFYKTLTSLSYSFMVCSFVLPYDPNQSPTKTAGKQKSTNNFAHSRKIHILLFF